MEKQKIVIVGGSGSIGSAIANEVLTEGFTPHIVGRNKELIEENANKLNCPYSIADVLETEKYYDKWSNDYDITLFRWKYTVPKKTINLLKKKINFKPKYILDLACGTGLFAEELHKVYYNAKLYGSDISKKSLLIAREKNIYHNLIKKNFE